jgi:hypothetical protein
VLTGRDGAWHRRPNFRHVTAAMVEAMLAASQ